MDVQQQAPVYWPKPFHLNRQKPVLQQYYKNDLPRDRPGAKKIDNNKDTVIVTDTSVQQSAKLRRSLEESRKAFFSLDKEHQQNLNNKDESSTVPQDPVVSRRPSKKISFKIKKSSSIYRKGSTSSTNSGRVTTISANSVAELTSRFNKLVTTTRHLHPKDEPKLTKLVNRVNSLRKSNKEDLGSRKTVDEQIYFIRRPSVKRKASVVKKLSADFPVKMRTEPGKVKATIEIFETITSLASPTSESKELPAMVVPKPKVPEKRFRPETVDLVNKNRERSTKLGLASGRQRCSKLGVSKEEETRKDDKEEECKVKERLVKGEEEEIYKVKERLVKDEEEEEYKVKERLVEEDKKEEYKVKERLVKDDKEEEYKVKERLVEEDKSEIVQVVNLPVITKRCDSKYETLNVSRVSPKLCRSEVFEDSCKSTISDVEDLDSTYTTVYTVNPEEPICNEENKIDTSETDYKLPEAPNKSFLWSRNIPEYPQIKLLEELEELYDSVDPTTSIETLTPSIPPRPTNLSLQLDTHSVGEYICIEDKIYEDIGTGKSSHQELDCDAQSSGYEYCGKYEELDDGYEYCENSTTDGGENIYETLPVQRKEVERESAGKVVASPVPKLPPKKQQIPLPPRPPSRNPSFYSQTSGEKVSNCYESIYNSSKRDDTEGNYESIDECLRPDIGSNTWGSASNASSDDKSNSLYVYGKCTSDRSSSDRTDEWVDLSDNEEAEVESIVVVREKSKVTKKNSGWSQKCREQRRKAGSTLLNEGDSDSDHIYESLCGSSQKPEQITEDQDIDAYDSFDSDSETEYVCKKPEDTNIDITNSKLPELPNNQTSVTTLAKTIRKNLTKSFNKMTKRKSELDAINSTKPKSNLYQNLPFTTPTKPPIEQPSLDQTSGDRTMKKGIFNKFRRSMTMVTEPSAADLPAALSASTRPKSTFYLTETIDFDGEPNTMSNGGSNSVENRENNKTVTNHRDYAPINFGKVKTSPAARPSFPPPPAPIMTANDSKSIKHQTDSTTLYAECGVFKSTTPITNNTDPNRKSSTNWYADVGLYQPETNNTRAGGSTGSTPATSSTENSGNTASEQPVTYRRPVVPVKATSPPAPKTANRRSASARSNEEDSSSLSHHRISEEYYNMKNGGVEDADREGLYYNDSVCSGGSGGVRGEEDDQGDDGDDDVHSRWQDEPLYQFYDAAILESEYKDSTSSNYDYDGYEEVGKRPSAMELITPLRNSIGSMSRTLWCEVPEVLQSSVLSTLTENQQKIQEAKFEMLTSEASYLHSLNVLVDYFVKNIKESELLTDRESQLLFGNIYAVKECSEKLLQDLEKCWQDNILLNNICEIVNRHAKESFHVYVTFCENQIFLDSTLNKLKERLSFSRLLEQLERSAACQSLKLNSFLLLPMQRITRWRLLVDAVLKRLIVQDDEYQSSRNTMATLSKIAQQCNEGARKMERDMEMKQISSQLEFHKGVPIIQIASGNRWLVRSGPLTQMVAKTSDLKVTFGKRFTKVSLFLFLFNDILLITKPRSKDNFVILHYCYRNVIEVNADESLESLPLKNAQGRHMIFLTILENHDEKIIELLLSCDSVSDKERWLEAILPPKSENPDEIIYEHWDCPQVTAVHNYTASQPDELSLNKGDVINVNKKLSDGWYHGEKISDSKIGWFPSNYSVEIVNPHVRARNLKMRYRLLAFSMNYVLHNQ